MSDNRRKVTFEYDITDLPAIAHAFAIASTTAMMTGNPLAQKRFAELKNMVDALIPEGARVFDGEDWCEIGICLKSAKQYGVCFESWGWHSEKGQTGRIYVQIDGRSWPSSNVDVPKNGPGIAAVSEVLKDLAPLNAEWIDIPDKKYPPPPKPGAEQPKPQREYYIPPGASL
jgi:hypothetical protein